MQRISIVGLDGFPLVKAGDNLAKMIVGNAKRENVPIDDGDIVAVSYTHLTLPTNREV